MNNLEFHKASPIGSVMKDLLRVNGLSEGMDRNIIYRAWDEASGAARYTIRRFYRNGRLTITLNSSAARASLRPRTAQLIQRLNEIVASDPLFGGADENPVKELILR